MAIGYFDKNSIESALKVGIDTGTPIFRDGNMEGLKGIKPLSSDEIEAIRSELKQCDENSKFLIFDASSEVTK